ncbi:MAG TPA: hypothetical protein VF476_03515 [Chitinophagaceae bacterium]
MKILFIVLLVAAIGAGAFFYLQKNKTTTGNDIKKEWIVGKWKIDKFIPGSDSTANFMVGIIGLIDSNALRYHYDFTNEGNVLRSLGDSVTKDSSRYEWTKEKQLIWKEDAADSTGTKFSVLTLNKDSLLIRDADSVQVLFLKAR